MLGINAALIFRLALPVLFFFVDGLTAPVFSPFGNVFLWRDEILTTSPDHSKR
jgi:predicted tellurium resistance membrane protein TerC